MLRSGNFMKSDNQKNILLVEDNEGHASLIQSELAMAGFDVVWWSDGAQAMEAVLNGSLDLFHLVLLDNKLPGCLGTEILKALNTSHSYLPVIFMTAEGNLEMAVEVMRLGAFDFVVKSPQMMTDLMKSISRALLFMEDKLEKQKLQVQLVKKEERFSRIIESLPQMLSYLDKDCVFRFTNSRFKEFFGEPGIHAEGKSIAEVFGQAFFSKRLPLIDQALKGLEVKYHEELKLENGFHCFVQGNLIPEKNERGEVEGFYDIMLDVSDFKNYERKLLEGEKKLIQILDALPLMVLQMSKDMRYVFVNKYYQQSIGRKSEDIVGKRLEEVISQDAYVQTLPFVKIVLKGERVRYTLVYKFSDGIARWIHGTLIPQLGENSEVVGYYAVLQDISEQIRVKQELELSEARFRAIVNQALDGMLIYNEKGEVLIWNDRLIDITGLSKEEAIGAKVYDLEYKLMPLSRKTKLFYEDLKQTALSIFNEPENVSKGLFREGKIVVPQTGEVRYVYYTSFPIRTGEGLLMGRLVKDLTSSKQTEAELRQLNQRFMLAQALVNIGVWDYKIKSSRSIWDEGMLRLLELEENFENKSVDGFLSLLHPEDREETSFVLERVFTHSGTGQITVRVKKAKDVGRNEQEYKYVKVVFNGMQNISGELSRIIGVLVDVSGEMEKMELQQQVRIAEKTAQLKQDFLANVSHEMRTPMNAIMGMTGFLERTQLNDAQKSFVTGIKDSSENLLSIINNVLDISRIESGTMTLFPKLFSLKTLARKLENTFRLEVNRKKLSLDYYFAPDEEVYFLADEHKVMQVVTNFVGNAIKFTERGGISIDFNLEKRPDFSSYVKISVTDTGIGIAEESQKKIFDKFYQLDSSATRNYQGAGLGLFISRQLAILMGGDAGVVSHPGLGSTFWFTFNVAFPEKEHEVYSDIEVIPFNEAHLKGLNILVVEDRILNYKVLSLMLESMGCKPVLAENGQIALDKVEKDSFDIILMDIQMPVMDGLTAVKHLRALYKDLPPVIALTANAMEGDAESFISQGMDDYISKPVNEQVLKEKLLYWAAKK